MDTDHLETRRNSLIQLYLKKLRVEYISNKHKSWKFNTMAAYTEYWRIMLYESKIVLLREYFTCVGST